MLQTPSQNLASEASVPVICASLPSPPPPPPYMRREVTDSAIAAARQRWPQVFGADLGSAGAGAEEQELRRGMRAVRPVLIKGYEAMVQVRRRLRAGRVIA